MRPRYRERDNIDLLIRLDLSNWPLSWTRTKRGWLAISGTKPMPIRWRCTSFLGRRLRLLRPEEEPPPLDALTADFMLLIAFATVGAAEFARASGRLTSLLQLCSGDRARA